MIELFTGAEGSGKTLCMTRTALEFLLYGGTVYGFPGYRVTDINGKQLSKDMDIEQWIMLPPDLKDAMICIDEMNNFFDAYRYNAVISRLFGSLSQQRRKRNLHIVGTVQDFMWLPPRLRWLVHILVKCWDLNWKYKNLEKGTMITVKFCDMKGFYTGHPGMWGKMKLIKRANKYWPFFDTYEVVDAINAFTQVRIHGTQVDLYRGKQPDIQVPDIPPMPDDRDAVPLDFREDMGFGIDDD